MRLFTAITPPPPVVEYLTRLQQSLHDAVLARWTRPANLHVTLKFLGEVSDQELPSLSRAIEEIQMRRFWLTVDQIVCFPPRGPIRIVGAAMRDESRLCAAFYEQIETVCEIHGFAREGRAYTPHVTLARPERRTPPHTREDLQSFAQPLLPGPEFEVQEFVLMQSTLTPKGSVYSPIARCAGF